MSPLDIKRDGPGSEPEAALSILLLLFLMLHIQDNLKQWTVEPIKHAWYNSIIYVWIQFITPII